MTELVAPLLAAAAALTAVAAWLFALRERRRYAAALAAERAEFSAYRRAHGPTWGESAVLTTVYTPGEPVRPVQGKDLDNRPGIRQR